MRIAILESIIMPAGHERPQCDLQLVVLPGHIEHYTYESWAQWAEKFNQYTTIWADNAYAGGKRTSLPIAYGHVQRYVEA